MLVVESRGMHDLGAAPARRRSPSRRGNDMLVVESRGMHDLGVAPKKNDKSAGKSQSPKHSSSGNKSNNSGTIVYEDKRGRADLGVSPQVRNAIKSQFDQSQLTASEPEYAGNAAGCFVVEVHGIAGGNFNPADCYMCTLEIEKEGEAVDLHGSPKWISLQDHDSVVSHLLGSLTPVSGAQSKRSSPIGWM